MSDIEDYDAAFRVADHLASAARRGSHFALLLGEITLECPLAAPLITEELAQVVARVNEMNDYILALAEKFAQQAREMRDGDAPLQ